MIYLGLVGFPLGHSLSPKLHSAALQSCQLEGDYWLFPIALEDRESLKDLLARVRAGKIHGLNVTVPHKQNVIPLLDELSPTAQAIGAVNTIYRHENKLIGHNTDAQGFLSGLTRFLDPSSIGSRHSALVLGAGGSARAVVYALLTNGWNVTIAARRIEQAQQLARSFLAPELHLSDNFANIDLSNISLIVNTTPVGMSPDANQSPWPADLPFPRGAAVYDLIYNPPETKLIRDARSQGLSATTGFGMLVEQAALAFEIWTGHCPSREIMLESIDQADN